MKSNKQSHPKRIYFHCSVAGKNKLLTFYYDIFPGARELLRKPGQSKDDIGFVKTMIAGAIGGMVLWTVIFPSDVIKSRIQISNQKEKFMTVAADIVKKEGSYIYSYISF